MMTESVAANEESELDLQMRARKLVRNYYNKQVAPVEDYPLVTTQQVYVVWFAKVLGNWKAMLGTVNSDGRYFEVTHNGETSETYVDDYEKQGQMVVSTPSITRERRERIDYATREAMTKFKAIRNLHEEGKTNAEIAKTLGISESSVRVVFEDS
jgi:hypothetical protein